MVEREQMEERHQMDQEPGRVDVIVVGNLTIDDVVLPSGRTSMAALGGNAVYAALGARLWSDRVGMVTRRGDDFPPAHLPRLRGVGIDIGGVVDVPGPTVRNWVVYEDDGRRHWVYRTLPERSAQVAVQPGDVPAAWLSTSRPPVVHIAAMPLSAATSIVERVRSACPGAVITLDTHEDWVLGHEQALLALTRAVDVFVPSREELRDLVGYDDPARAVRELRSAGVRATVVKLGGDGALVAAAGAGEVSVPACSVPVVDTTGAGDAFCGGLAAGLALGLPLADAVRRGTVSASFAVGSFGSDSLADVGPQDAQARLASTATPASTEADAYEIDVMLREIDMIPQVIEHHLRDRGGDVQRIADLLVAEGIEHVFLTGCGDSAFAGSATALAFTKHAGVAAEGVHALELARYRVRYLPERSAVLAVSFSGKVGRTTEALVQARRFGHLTIALTNNTGGNMAAAAEHVLPIDVPTLGFSPGTSTYLGMVTTLLDLSLRWGQARGRDVSAARAQLAQAPRLATQTLAANADPTRKAVALLEGRPWVTFVGAGPNEASARFGAAKLFEGPQVMGVATNTEEWAHEEYFVSGPGTPVVVVAPSGASYDRSEEILSELEFIGAVPIVVSDRAPVRPVHLLPVAAGLPEEFSPLLTALPLSLLGFHLAEALGKRSYNFASEELRVEHYDTIHRATVGEPA